MADEKLDYSDPSLLLSEVNKAIATVMVGGQSYKIGRRAPGPAVSRSLTRANLTELRNLRADLAAQVEEQGNTDFFRNTYAAFFEGR